jgi:hypothetical protein
MFLVELTGELSATWLRTVWDRRTVALLKKEEYWFSMLLKVTMERK